MREFRDPLQGGSNDYDLDEEQEDPEVRSDQAAPGKRSRTAHLEGLADPSLVARARRLGTPPTIPLRYAPASNLIGAIYRKQAPSAVPEADATRQVELAQSSRGEALPEKLRRRIELALGADLKDVRIHTGSESAAAARSVGARAYTVGRQVHFASGEYDPDSKAGQRLIAHELAHAVQQKGSSGTPGEEMQVSSPGDTLEVEADRFADAFVATDGPNRPARLGASPRPLSPVSVGVSRAVLHRDTSPVQLIADSFGGSPDKAKAALRKAGGNRASVVQAIKQVFNDEQAKEILKAVPAGGGQAPPQVKGADAKPQKKSGKPAQDAGAAGGKGKKGGAGAKGGGGGGQPTAGGKAPGAGGEPKADTLPDEITSSELQLIYQEIVEHEAWAGARAAVGEAGSSERAAFIAEQAGRGAITGFTTGAIMGAASGIVGQLAARYVPIPGVGAMIAGGMAAYGLITRDWAQTFDTIGQFGQGSSTYEVLANTIASISEVIDLVVNVANVIAGIIGVISALMWLITIITVGVASPLAGTLSAIALGIVTVTGILDNINNLVLQPLVLLFRAMHTFTSDADPRDVEEQGAGISDAANKVASALGGMAGGKAADAAGAGAKRMAYKRAQRQGGGGAGGDVHGGGASKPVVEGVDTPTPHGEGGTPHAEGGTPHGEGGTPHVDEPSAPTPHGEDGGAPTPHGDDGSTPAPHGDEGGAPTQHAEAEGSPTQPGQEPGTPARQDEGPGVDPATRQQRAQDAVNESNSRWDRVKKTYRDRKNALKKEFTDHWAKQKAESLKEQRRLDDAERRGQQQRREEIDRDAQTAKDRADTEYENAVRRGESEARTEADNRLRRDRDAANERYLEAEQRANAAERDTHIEAARTRRQQKADAMDSYSRERSRIRQERRALREEYHEARRRLREAEAGPEAEAQLQQRYEADRARLGEELTANQDTYRAAIKAADAEYSQRYDQASQTRDDAVAAAKQTREADFETAEQMRGARERRLAEAAKKQAEEARDSSHEAADARAQRRHEGGEEGRAGRRAVREERRAKANEERFGEGVREDPRTRRKKFWDFWSGAAAREKWRKTYDKAMADQRQVYDDYRSRKGAGESEWQATKKSFGADRPNRITNDPTASGAGKILARGKQYVEAGVKSVVGQDQKSEEEKKEAAKKPSNDPFFHKAVSQPGKYWFQGGWKEAQEKKKAEQQARFAPGTKAPEKAKERFKVSKKRVNPNYSSGPPASPVELQKIRSYIEAEYETKAKAEAAKRDAAIKKAKAEGDAPRLKELKAEAEKAKQTNESHKASVKQKKQANVDQGRRQANADGVMPDFGNRIAGITVLETPLAAFIGFAWIGKKLGSDSFARMHKDAVKMQKQFVSMKTIFKSQEAKQPANKAKQKADSQRVDAVDKKAAKSGSSLDQSHTMTVSLDSQNKQKIQQGAAAHAQASQQSNEHKAKAKKGEAEYKALRGKLVSWAHKHKAERDAAIAQEKNATDQPLLADLTFPVAKISKPGDAGGGGGGGQGDSDSAGQDDAGQQGKQGKKKGQGQDQQAQDQQGKQGQGQPGQQGQPGGKQTSPGQQQPSPQPQQPQQSGPTQKQDGPSPAPPNQGGQSPAPSNPPDSE